MVSPRPWSLVHAHLHQVLRQRSLLPMGEAVLIAVSGGQDSVCLARLIVDLQRHWGWRLAIAHCDHQWPEDVGLAEFVQTLAAGWQLPYYQATATQLPRQEAAARTWRYQALSQIAQAHRFTTVVTGHTASDRAETLLYNLVRGSGSDGLQALTWSRPLDANLRLVRPILGLTRSQTGEFCQIHQLSTWLDAANTDLSFRRNRIRQELMPYLHQRLNPRAEIHLAQTAELLQAEVEYLEQTAEQLYSQVVRHLPAEEHDLAQKLGLHRPTLTSIPLALQRRIVRRSLQTVLAGRANFEQIEQVIQLIDAANRSQTASFPGGITAWVDADWIWLGQPPRKE